MRCRFSVGTFLNLCFDCEKLNVQLQTDVLRQQFYREFVSDIFGLERHYSFPIGRGGKGGLCPGRHIDRGFQRTFLSSPGDVYIKTNGKLQFFFFSKPLKRVPDKSGFKCPVLLCTGEKSGRQLDRFD